MMYDDGIERSMHEEDNKHVWAQKSPAYFSKLVFFFVDRWATLANSAEVPPSLPREYFSTNSSTFVPCFLAMFILGQVRPHRGICIYLIMIAILMYLLGNQDRP
jgi:hypothetical protein